MLKAVHLFNPELGSRYPQMISQGLINHPDVGVSFNQPVISLGQEIRPAKFPELLRAEMTWADLIFRPSRSHFHMPEWDDFLNRANLWGKVIYYDFRDDEQIDTEYLCKCRLYVKRTWPDGGAVRQGKMLHVPYGILDEYLFYQHLSLTRDIDFVYLFTPNPDNPAERSRYRVYQALERAGDKGDLKGFIYGLGQKTREGRRAIFEPMDDNPFLDYLMLLKRAKVVITIMPDHNGGDSRIWEAFASGAAVLTNFLNPVRGFRNQTDYFGFNPNDDNGIEVMFKLLFDLIKNDSVRKMVGELGQKMALDSHMAVNRIGSILDNA